MGSDITFGSGRASSEEDLSHGARRHLATWVSFDELGDVGRPYRPTYESVVSFINSEHRAIGEAPKKGILIDLGIAGWLRPADALKLYELAYFARGDVIEFGTNCGLSAFVLASAVKSAERGHRVLTVEIDDHRVAVAKNNLAQRHVADVVDFYTGDAGTAARVLIKQGRTFDLCFVDHSHAYEPMVEICGLIADFIRPGGFVAFHDFTDRRNTRKHGVGESSSEYGVYAAIEDALDSGTFEFYGVYGSSAVFRKSEIAAPLSQHA